MCIAARNTLGGRLWHAKMGLLPGGDKVNKAMARADDKYNPFNPHQPTIKGTAPPTPYRPDGASLFQNFMAARGGLSIKR